MTKSQSVDCTPISTINNSTLNRRTCEHVMYNEFTPYISMFPTKGGKIAHFSNPSSSNFVGNASIRKKLPV